jgi:hypothetical protein
MVDGVGICTVCGQTKNEIMGSVRWLTIADVSALPNAGITDVIDLDTDARDRGGEYLIVERGTRLGTDLVTRLTATGRLVATRAEAKTARGLARKLQAKNDRDVIGGRFDVVPRSGVRLRATASDYGAYSGDVG